MVKCLWQATYCNSLPGMGKLRRSPQHQPVAGGGMVPGDPSTPSIQQRQPSTLHLCSGGSGTQEASAGGA